MSVFTPRSMMVTGGAGFIGSNFVRHMLSVDPEVRIVNLDALTYAGSLDNLRDLPAPERHRFVHGDICNGELVARLLAEHQVDCIVHFAAESHVDNSIAGPEAFMRTNVLGSFTLLDTARRFWLGELKLDKGVCRFHHISTDEVYGTLGPDDPAFSEATPYAPNSPYSASKAGSDHLVRAWHHTYGLPVVTTNCSNNYGPRQHAEKFIPTVIRCCLEGKPIPVYGDGSNIRDWLFVDDHCRGIEAVLRRGRLGETYNIGGINEWANSNIAQLICTLMDEFSPERAPHARLISFVQDRPGHDWRYAIDTKKIAEELGWKPAETFDTGIRKTIGWYLKPR
jgi:dTDP-glucose 4,6-dehydratase